MTDLNVSVIAKWIDGLTGPARKSAAALTGVATAQKASAKASTEQAKAQTVLSKTTVVAAKGTASLSAAVYQGATAAIEGGKSWMGYAAAMLQGATAAQDSERAQTDLGDATGRAADAADAGYRKFSLLERSQFRAQAAGRALGSQMDQLQGKLAKLGLASMAMSTLSQGGATIMRPIEGSVERQAQFERRMTGIGIMGDLNPSQLTSVRSNIFRNASALGLPVDTVQQDDMAVLNESVYRRAADLNIASKAAAKISLLGDITDSPVTGQEAGALISTYAHTLGLPAAQIDAYNAMLFRSSQLGGDRIGDVAHFMPQVMAQMKGSDFGNRTGYIDALAAFQIVKRVAGNDEAAGTDLQDLMANLNHRLTRRRFAKENINLDKVIYAARLQGKSPLEAVMDALRPVVARKAAAEHRTASSVLGEFFQNQQAMFGALALLQYKNDGPQGLGFDHLRQLIGSPEAQARYHAGVDQASNGTAAALQRQKDAQDELAVQTGTVLEPTTRLATKIMSRLAGAMTAAEKKGGPLGTAAVTGIAGAGLVVEGVGKLGQFTIGMMTLSIVAKELFGKSLPTLLRLARARVVGFAAAAIPVVWGFTVAILANPLTWWIAGIVAVGVAGYLLIKNWSAVKTWLGGFWKWIETSVASAFDKVRAFFSWKPPAWLATIAGVAAMSMPGGPALAATVAALNASRPHAPAAQAAHGAGAPHPAQAAAAHKAPVTVHVTNHFHGPTDASADWLHKLEKAVEDAARRALHDGPGD